MTYLTLPTHDVHYQIDGTAGKPWLTFSNSLGTDISLWSQQVAALAPHFQILRYDNRGHGQSGLPAGNYAMADLAGDVLALWDALEIEKSHFCGLSIGAMTGMYLGANAGARLHKLVLCGANVKMGTAEEWAARFALARSEGLPALVDTSMERWFSPAFTAAHPDVVAAVRAEFLATSLDGYMACCYAISQSDFTLDIPRIAVPSLLLGGNDDPVCTPEELQAIAQRAQAGEFVEIVGKHIFNMTAPEAFNAALMRFLSE